MNVLSRPLSVSDADLLARNFTVSNPEELPGFVRGLPPERPVPDIEFAYDLTPPKGKERNRIWCSHCGRARHWRGYVVSWPDGMRTTVGKDCGAKTYGVEFKTAENAFSAQKVRQSWLQRFHALKANFLPLLRAVGEIRQEAAVAEFARLREALRDIEPLEGMLLTALRNDEGVLHVEERVRDVQAELKRNEPDEEGEGKGKGAKKKAAYKQIYKTVRRPMGRVAGDAFLCSTGDLAGQLSASHDRLKAIWRDIERKDTEDFRSVSTFRTLFAKVASAIEEIEGVEVALQAAQAFLVPGNLRLVAAWAEAVHGNPGTYAVRGRRLARMDADGVERSKIGLDDGWRLPDLTPVRSFKTAIS